MSKNRIERIENSNDVKKMFNELEFFGKHDEYIFRGHIDENYKLLPSLYRFLNNDIDSYYLGHLNENNMFTAFENLVGDKKIEFYQVLQHYGLKTKLLDFTHDPFIALFFAVKDWPFSEKTTKDVNGELLILKNTFHQISKDEASSFGELLFMEKDGFVGQECVDELGETIHVSFSNKCQFIDGVIRDENSRIAKQKSCFLVFPNYNFEIKEIDKNICIKRYIISSKVKDKISKKLANIEIDYEHLL